MRNERPLDDLFHSQSHVRVLRALDELPAGLTVSARDLARRSGLSHPTTSRVLGSLADQGLVVVRRAPRADAFELNRAHVLTPKLIALFEWERQVRGEFVGFLRREINRHTHAVSAAYLFGSILSSEMAATSDIDVAVVCPPARREEVEAAMERVAAAVRNRFGNHLSAIFRSSIAPYDSGDKASRLWTRILKEGTPIVDSGRIPVAHSARTRSGDG